MAGEWSLEKAERRSVVTRSLSSTGEDGHGSELRDVLKMRTCDWIFNHSRPQRAREPRPMRGTSISEGHALPGSWHTGSPQ
uniref:Uncharacterized protein n=1 Tax=Knipowitschia caucasica TaxID=637954 RepID=A0AAV2LSX8_KNICA